jgi:DNA-binding NarL/FixJ family response regulator
VADRCVQHREMRATSEKPPGSWIDETADVVRIRRIQPATARTGALRALPDGPDRQRAELIAPGRRPQSGLAPVGTPIRVLIAAGHALVRASYRALLESDERIEVIAEADTGRQALASATDSTPDVALMDLSLPGLDGLEGIAAIVSDPALERVPVMLIASQEHDEQVVSALRAGAVGVLSKDAEAAELIHAVQLLARGNALLPAGVARRLLAEVPAQPPPREHSLEELSELTDREREVVALVARGLSNGEIAAQLVISPATAKTHVSRAMVKLHARDRSRLVVLAYETGLVSS